MNPLFENFKECAHMAGEVCQITTDGLIRQFGLQDFLENSIQESDDASAIALKALRYF